MLIFILILLMDMLMMVMMMMMMMMINPPVCTYVHLSGFSGVCLFVLFCLLGFLCCCCLIVFVYHLF